MGSLGSFEDAGASARLQDKRLCVCVSGAFKVFFPRSLADAKMKKGDDDDDEDDSPFHNHLETLQGEDLKSNTDSDSDRQSDSDVGHGEEAREGRESNAEVPGKR